MPEDHERGVHLPHQFLYGCGVSVRCVREIDGVSHDWRPELLGRGQDLASHALLDDREDAHNDPRLETQFFH